MPIMRPRRNVIIFGDPIVDRLPVLKLAGGPQAFNADYISPTEIFEFKEHSSTISGQKCVLYDAAGLTDLDSNRLSLSKARQALGNLYCLTRAFDSERVHLLLYVVSDQPSIKNFRLFHDYLCRRKVPIILVTTDPEPLSMPHGFPPLPTLTLNNASSENDKTKLLQSVILKHVTTKEPKSIDPILRFELTTRESWRLLEREAGWTPSECRKALEETLVEDAKVSKEEVRAICQRIAEYIRKHYFCNVIVFGDTGAGKSSVIRMLTDECKIDTKKASSAGGSTFKSEPYDVDIEEYHYVFHDTVGLDDQTSESTMSPEEALRALYQLILKVDGGVSLLVYVHRGKIKPSQVSNYRLFSHVICNKKVPTVLVVTGLEEEDLETDVWWNANEHLYTAQDIETRYHACITSTQGKFNKRSQEYTYQTEYENSKEKLKELFLKAALEKPWKINKTASFWRSLVVQVYNIFANKFKWGPLVANPLLYKNLMDIVGMEDDAAMSLANKMERVFDSGKLKSESTSTLNTVDQIKKDATVTVDPANVLQPFKVGELLRTESRSTLDTLASTPVSPY